MLATGDWSVLFAMTIISAITSCSVLLSAYLELENPCLPFKVMFLFPPLARVTCMGWSVYKCGWGQIKSLGMDAFLTESPWRGMGGTCRGSHTDSRKTWQVIGRKETENPKADVCVTAQCKNGTADDSESSKRSNYVVVFKKGSKIPFCFSNITNKIY